MKMYLGSTYDNISYNAARDVLSFIKPHPEKNDTISDAMHSAMKHGIGIVRGTYVLGWVIQHGYGSGHARLWSVRLEERYPLEDLPF